MLDKVQQEIVDSKEPRIIVEAGAGSREDSLPNRTSKKIIIGWSRAL